MRTLIALLVAAIGVCSSGCRGLRLRRECRAHHDVASCRHEGAPNEIHCFPVFKCEPDPDRGDRRCEKACKDETGVLCGYPDNIHDGCLGKYNGGRWQGCFPSDNDPTRCTEVRDKHGVPHCVDRREPCAGCRPAFDYCDAFGCGSLYDCL